MFVRSAVEETLAGAAEEEAVTGFSGYGIPTVLILLKGDFDVFERAANAVCKGKLHIFMLGGKIQNRVRIRKFLDNLLVKISLPPSK